MESIVRGQNRELVRIGILGQRGDGIATLRQAMFQRARIGAIPAARGQVARRLVKSNGAGADPTANAERTASAHRTANADAAANADPAASEADPQPTFFATPGRLYSPIEWPATPEYGVTANDFPLMDGAVLVVSAVHGPRAGARRDILRARQAGIGHIVVFVSMTDAVDDIDLPALVELETRDMLSRFGYRGDAVRVVRGSALQALREPSNDTAASAIDDLLDALDRTIPAPVPIVSRPLLMAVQTSGAVNRGDAQVTGRIERGRVRVGQIIEVAGLSEETRLTEVLAIACDGRAADAAQAGDDVSLVLADLKADEVFRGHVIASPASTLPRTRFAAQIRLFEASDGGRSAPLPERYTPQFYFRNGGAGGEVLLDRGAAPLRPGDTAIVDVELSVLVALQIGQRFVIREGGRTVGIGFVVKFLD